SRVKSVPVLVMNGAAFHINFGAGIDALKQPFKSADCPELRGVSHDTPPFLPPNVKAQPSPLAIGLVRKLHITKTPLPFSLLMLPGLSRASFGDIRATASSARSNGSGVLMRLGAPGACRKP